MTVIRPNSISGINSITAQGGDITYFKSDGTAGNQFTHNIQSTGVVTATKFVGPIEGNVTGNLSGGTINAASATITGNLGVGGVLTYEDVTNIDSIGIVTARLGINLVGNDLNVGSNIKIGNASGIITATSFRGDASQMTGAGLGTDGSANTSGIITATAFVPTTGQLSHKNKIINGAQLVSQRRGNLFTSTVQNDYMTDRFFVYLASMDQMIQSIQQVTDSPDGFSRSLKLTTTTPENSIESNEYMYVGTKLEGQDLQDLAYGTSNAKPIVLSFYVKSSITGTYAVNIYGNESTDRSINRTYTINSANTWERKILPVIAGDTARVITDDINKRFEISWMLAAGSDWTSGSANNTWGNWSNQTFAVGHAQNGVITTNGATWQITGVQLEVGPVATPFEHRSYTDELARCRRYFYKPLTSNTYIYGGRWGNNSTNTAVYYPVQMRDTPTIGGSARRSGGTSYVGKDYFNYAVGNDDNWWENFTASAEFGL